MALNEAIISAAAALAVCIVNNFVIARNSKEQHDKTIALIEYRIEELSKRVEKHNNLVERTAVLERDVKTAFNKMDALEDDVREMR